MYRVNAEAIRPLHEWTSTFERYWQHQLNRVKEHAERKSSSWQGAIPAAGQDKSDN
jgi:hypothetical protein